MMEVSQPSPSTELVKQLLKAAETGDLERTQRLLNDLEADQRDFLLRPSQEYKGQLPFHGAARGGHMSILKLLLPEALQDLIDTPSNQVGWSCVHLAAAFGHARAVEWLCKERMADLNLQARDGNTPMHLAVALGHKDVVRFLVSAGANLFSLNWGHMMPLSLCKDADMFEAFFCNYTADSASLSRVRIFEFKPLPLDGEGRSFLHHTAQFATDSDRIAKLILELEPEELQRRDERGYTFLHVAAKAGNLHILHALRKAGIAINHLVSTISSDVGVLNPGLCALLHDQREFFNELIATSKVVITLERINQVLMAELIDKPEIESRLSLLATTLPTYLALYAKKECIYNFLLETTLVSLSQWDEEQKRTCLHWAVLDSRIDIVRLLVCNDQVWPGIQDADGKTALQHAFENKDQRMMDVLMSNRAFKEYEAKLDRNREIYLLALNAFLVVAGLIASVTFAGWLQLPSGDFDTLSMKVFWASNCVAFFAAVATMGVTITALIPTPSKYIESIVNQLRLAIVIDAVLLALSVVAVVWAFAAAGFAALHHVHTSSYMGIMRSTTAMGGLLCLIMWIAFVFQLYKCAPPGGVLIALLFPSVPPSSFLNRWFPASWLLLRTRIGDSSRFGHLSRSRVFLDRSMGDDLVPHVNAGKRPLGMVMRLSSTVIPLDSMAGASGNFCKSETKMSAHIFMENAYKHKEFERSYEWKKEKVNRSITDDFQRS